MVHKEKKRINNNIYFCPYLFGGGLNCSRLIILKLKKPSGVIF